MCKLRDLHSYIDRPPQTARRTLLPLSFSISFPVSTNVIMFMVILKFIIFVPSKIRTRAAGDGNLTYFAVFHSGLRFSYAQGEMTSQNLWSRYVRHFVGIVAVLDWLTVILATCYSCKSSSAVVAYANSCSSLVSVCLCYFSTCLKLPLLGPVSESRVYDNAVV